MKKNNKCFQYAITLALNYNTIKRKDLQKILKTNWSDIDFPWYQKDWKKFEQNNTSIALNVLFVSYNSEEITLAYESKYNYNHENQVILLMINDKVEKCYYFAVKILSELYSFEWLRSKKAAIINGDNGFQNALNDVLNY